ncbi:hypothetical protein BJV78DRAFT_1257448 [Lactifluus subvellereus]|nr:hypothetical protein BJV78DRAFT_1257448 [Lactifluus subvellereus]
MLLPPLLIKHLLLCHIPCQGCLIPRKFLEYTTNLSEYFLRGDSPGNLPVARGHVLCKSQYSMAISYDVTVTTRRTAHKDGPQRERRSGAGGHGDLAQSLLVPDAQQHYTRACVTRALHDPTTWTRVARFPDVQDY